MRGDRGGATKDRLQLFAESYIQDSEHQQRENERGPCWDACHQLDEAGQQLSQEQSGGSSKKNNKPGAPGRNEPTANDEAEAGHDERPENKRAEAAEPSGTRLHVLDISGILESCGFGLLFLRYLKQGSLPLVIHK